MTIKKTIPLILFLLLAFDVTSQPARINFSSLTTKDGLLSNTVNAILKDRYGWMWFATDDGLNKFDGTHFTVYRHVPGDTGSLRANEILSLHEDSAGNLWIGTSGGGISLYDRKKDRFLHYARAGDPSGFVTNAVVRGICSDPTGKIWIAEFQSPYVLDPASGKLTRIDIGNARVGTTFKMSMESVYADARGWIWIGTDKGLFRYDPRGRAFRQFRHDPGDTNSLLNDRVRAITADRSGKLWIGTDGGLCSLRSDEGVFVRCPGFGGDKTSFAGNPVNAIVPDSNGKLWIGTADGIRVLDPLSGICRSYRPNGNEHGLTSPSIKSICIDKEGIYWFGTDRGGIDKYDQNLNLFDVALTGMSPGSSNENYIVTAFAESPDGRLWVGTDDGGLYTFDRGTARLLPYPLLVDGKPIHKLIVLSLKAARNGLLYIGTLGEGLIVLDCRSGVTRHLRAGSRSDELSGNEIYNLLEDSKGRIWAGTNGQGLNVVDQYMVVARYLPVPGNSDDLALPVNGYIRALEEDGEGNIWIGTHGGGLAVCHVADHSFSLYDQANSGLPIDKIHSLLKDRQGRIWVGTYGGGLSVFDKHRGRFTNYSEQDGLPNTTIYQILQDLQGFIWVSTNTGISRFDPGKKSFRNFTYLNGLRQDNFAHGSGLRLADGQLVFGGPGGFNYLDPSRLTMNRNAPAVVLTDLQVANRSVQPGEKAPIGEPISIAGEIRLDYKQNFSLSFVALNYTLPKQTQYAYKLDGFDKDWNFSGSTNTAKYTNLDPGSYLFRVKASNNDGLWSTRERTIVVDVKPPFWRTVYAYLFYILAAGSLLIYSRHRGLSKVRKKFQLEREQGEISRVRELDRMKLKFLTNLSHEFRTPIALIMGPVNELLSYQKDERSTEKLQMVRRNARRLLNLVNQLLDFRKMEEQELKLLLKEGELVSFVKDVVHAFTDLSGRKHIQLSFTSNLTALYVSFDHDKIERILFNLLSNAFKFTMEEGQISVVLDAAGMPDPANGKKPISIRVTDTGIGIPADKLQPIFERFFQHASAEGVLNQGTGIGLSITKEFVRMHGGTIDVQSEPGRGSSFTVCLPLQELPEQSFGGGAVADEVADVAAAGEQPVSPSDKPIVLVVEDNEDFRFYLKDNLRQHYRIVEAANGKEGWQKALSAHPHLIVTDISMPYMDGIELSKKLKADKRTGHIPIILLTALTGEAQEVRGLATGANDYITKPFTFEVLQAKIKNLLELERTLRTTYTRQIKWEQPEVTLISENERLLQAVVRCLEENMLNQQLSVDFLSRQVGMSRSSLYSKILEITGETPVEYIRSFKLEKAARLLEKSDLAIAEVAYQTGFSTPNYFARAFKVKYNLLPSDYIAQKRKPGANKRPDDSGSAD